MSRLVLELPPEQRERLQAVANAQQRSEEEICIEALDQFLQNAEPVEPGRDSEARELLLGLIGLVKDGPTDASIYHDIRPEDPPH